MMFIVHQIVNALINPAFAILLLANVGTVLIRRDCQKTGKVCCWLAMGMLFFLSWPPFVDYIGLRLEADYPAAHAEDYPAADAIVVLGGGVGSVPAGVEYPYPLLREGADRVWFAAKLWRAQKSKFQGPAVKIYCTGPDVSKSTPPFLLDLGVPSDAIVALDGPLNTEEEAKRYAKVFGDCGFEIDAKRQSSITNHQPRILLVTSALHMKRAAVIFKKYAPQLKIIPSPTDHQFFRDPQQFVKWQYYIPNLGSLALFSAIEHELIGLLRYCL